MQVQIQWHILPQTVVISYDGTVKKIKRNSQLGKDVIQCIKDGNLAKIPNMVDIELRIKNESNSEFEVINGQVYTRGEKVHPLISARIIEFIENEIPFKYLVNFWNNLKQNPSPDSVDQLFGFLEANDFPLTEDGCFIAYKKVRGDFMDDYTGTMDNSVGNVVSENRDLVDPDRHRSCSKGLHIAPYEYAKVYKHDGRLIQLKVNPRDVVAVPDNYAHQKSRVCEYEVLADVTEAGKPVYSIISTADKDDTLFDMVLTDGELVDKSTVESNTTAKNAVNLDDSCSHAPAFIDIEEESIDEDAIENTAPVANEKVEHDSSPAVAFFKLGNFKYKAVVLSKSDYALFGDGLENRKASRWAKAFTDYWKKDIKKVERLFNGILNLHEYVVTLKNGMMFYIIAK